MHSHTDVEKFRLCPSVVAESRAFDEGIGLWAREFARWETVNRSSRVDLFIRHSRGRARCRGRSKPQGHVTTESNQFSSSRWTDWVLKRPTTGDDDLVHLFDPRRLYGTVLIIKPFVMYPALTWLLSKYMYMRALQLSIGQIPILPPQFLFIIFFFCLRIILYVHNINAWHILLHTNKLITFFL